MPRRYPMMMPDRNMMACWDLRGVVVIGGSVGAGSDYGSSHARGDKIPPPTDTADAYLLLHTPRESIC